jgi:hypothetical protein
MGWLLAVEEQPEEPIAAKGEDQHERPYFLIE